MMGTVSRHKDYVQECNEQVNIDRDAVSPETRRELLRDTFKLTYFW